MQRLLSRKVIIDIISVFLYLLYACSLERIVKCIAYFICKYKSE